MIHPLLDIGTDSVGDLDGVDRVMRGAFGLGIGLDLARLDSSDDFGQVIN